MAHMRSMCNKPLTCDERIPEMLRQDVLSRIVDSWEGVVIFPIYQDWPLRHRFRAGWGPNELWMAGRVLQIRTFASAVLGELHWMQVDETTLERECNKRFSSPIMEAVEMTWWKLAIDPVFQAALADPVTVIDFIRHSENVTSARSACIRVLAYLSTTSWDETWEPRALPSTADIERRKVRMRLSEYISTGWPTDKPSALDPLSMVDVWGSVRYIQASATEPATFPTAREVGEKPRIDLEAWETLHAEWHKCSADECKTAKLLGRSYLNCPLPWKDGPPAQRIESNPWPHDARDATTITEELANLVSKRVIQIVPPSEEQRARAILPIGVARKYRFTVEHEMTLPPSERTEALRMKAKLIWAAFKANLQSMSPMLAFNTACREFEVDEKPRLVFDGRDLSEYLMDLPFELPAVQDVLTGLEEGWFIAAIDVKGGFHHIFMSEESSWHMCFRWGGQLYRWLRLPFGIKSAPFIFCMLTAEITAILRHKKINVQITYVDDMVMVSKSKEDLQAALKITEEVFASLNIELSKEKTKQPHTIQTVLGISINTETMRIKVPDRSILANVLRIMVMQECYLDNTLRASLRHRIPKSFVRSTTGKLRWQSSTTPASLPYMHPFWYLVGEDKYPEKGYTNSMVSLKEAGGLEQALNWWSRQATSLGARICIAPRVNSAVSALDTLISTDASPHLSFGGIQASTAIWGRFSDRYDTASSTAAEMYGSMAALIQFTSQGSDKWDLPAWEYITTDNASNAYALNKGTSDCDTCRRYVKGIFHLLEREQREFVAVYQPRQSNHISDLLSKASTLEEAQCLLDKMTVRCRRDRIRVFNAPVFRVDDLNLTVYHVCSDDSGCWPTCNYQTVGTTRRHPLDKRITASAEIE
jgi:hypothetical protein